MLGGVNLRVDLRCVATRRVEQVEVGAGLVDDAAAVGGGVARVEVLVAGVPGQVVSAQGARIEVAGALVVGLVPVSPVAVVP